MDYPHGWSFWSRDEWKALKDRRTDHYAKLKVKAQGTIKMICVLLFNHKMIYYEYLIVL